MDTKTIKDTLSIIKNLPDKERRILAAALAGKRVQK